MKYKLACGCEVELINPELKPYDNLPSIKIDYENIDEDCKCPLLWDVYQTGNTKGVFQLEAGLGRHWSKEIKPSNLSDLSAIIALIRPGSLNAMIGDKSATQHYADRKNGIEEVEYIHPAIMDILESTQQIITYQEQAMQIACRIAGFSEEDADKLRKAIGSKDAKLMQTVRQMFIDGCKQVKLVTDIEAGQIFDIIENANRYGFNKSHSVAYAKMGLWSAFTKAHFPLHYMCACLEFCKDKDETKNFVQETRRLGFDVFTPDIRELFSGNPGDFIINRGIVRFGIGHISSMGDKGVVKLIDAIKQVSEKLNKTIDKFAWSEILIFITPIVGVSMMENLVMAGAFDWYLSRNQALHEISVYSQTKDTFREWAVLNYQENDTLSTMLTTAVSLGSGKGKPSYNKNGLLLYTNLIQLLAHPPYSIHDSDKSRNIQEKKMLGMALSNDYLTDLVASTGSIYSDEIATMTSGSVSIIGTIQKLIKKKDRNDNQMCFFSLEDDVGICSGFCVFSDKYEQYEDIIYEGRMVIVKGSISVRDQWKSIIVNKMKEV